MNIRIKFESGKQINQAINKLPPKLDLTKIGTAGHITWACCYGGKKK